MAFFQHRNRYMLPLGLVFALCCTAISQTSQKKDSATEEPEDLENPYTSESDIQRGHLIIRAYCSVCHGQNGQGGRGPSLISGTFRRGSSNTAILKNIKNGVAGTDMPAFPVEDDMIWPLVSYMRDKAKPQPPPPGCAKKGKELFAKHNCVNCHWRGTTGGRRGPDLSALAGPAEYIRESIVDPDANFREQPAFQHNPYQRVIVITQNGRTFEGRWMNENGYHLQFIDQDENLQTIERSNIDETFKPAQSLMPSFRDVLEPEELRDLIKYVFSLRPAIEEEGGSE